MRLFLVLIATACFAQSDRARKLHADALVFDAHVHMMNRQLYDGTDIGTLLPNGQVDLVRAKQGGLDGMFFSVFVNEPYYPGRHETQHLLRLLDLAHQQIEKNHDKIELAYGASDVQRISKAGKIAAVLDVEGGFDLDGDLGVLRSFYKLGLRVAQLPAHNWANNFAESCCATQKKFSGLNDQGRAVVKEMNRLGMVINVSHASDQTIEQVVDLSKHPVMATHHGLRSFNDIPRLLPDPLVKKIASKGGVIGFHIGCDFHSRRVFEYRTKQTGKVFWDTRDIGAKEAQMSLAEIDKISARGFPMVGIEMPDDLRLSVDEWFNVVDRVIALVGDDHIALGSDWDGGPSPPRGVRDIRDLPMLTEAMLKRGYSEERIRKFLGGNTLRVLRTVTGK